MADRRCRLCFALWLLIGAGETSTILAASDPIALEPDTRSVADRVFEGESELRREHLLRLVLERNPTLHAARSALAAALALSAQAESLPDPMLSYSFAPQSIGSDSVPYGHVLRYSQRLPSSGKRRLRREIAEARALTATHNVDWQRLHLATVASLLYDDYYVVERAIEINEEHVELLEMFKRIATARYAAGEAGQQAPLQAEVEAAHLVHRRVVLSTERELVLTRLNAVLHRSPEAWVPPSPQALVVSEPRRQVTTGDRLTAAVGSRPEVLAARSELEAKRLEIELAKVASKPDFEVMGSYNSMWRQSDHRLMIGAGVNLPLYRGRLQAAEAQAEAEAVAIESAIAGIVDEVRAEVASSLLRAEEAEHVVSLYRSRILPASSDQVSAALAGFTAGQSTFLALIDAERNQRSVRLEYEEALANVYRRRAELDRALGRLPGVEGERP